MKIHTTFGVISTLLFAAASQAETVYTFPSGKGGIYLVPGFDAVEGNKFKVGAQDILVSRLGYEFQRNNQQSNPTGLFDAVNGNLLVSADISGADSLENGYYWKAIAPTVLAANHEYFIGSFHGTGVGNEYYWNTNVATVPSFISDEGTWFKVTNTLAGGTWEPGGGGIRHYVGNFDAAIPVPEPASMTLLSLGVIAAIRRKREA